MKSAALGFLLGLLAVVSLMGGWLLGAMLVGGLFGIDMSGMPR